MKTQASGAVPPITAPLKALWPVRRRRYEGSAWRPRESPRIRICGLRLSLAMRSSLIDRSVGGFGEAAVALAATSPARRMRSASVWRGRTAVISELEVDEGVGLGDGHDGDRSCDANRRSLPDARPQPDLPAVRCDVDEDEQRAHQQHELRRQQCMKLHEPAKPVQAEHRGEHVAGDTEAGGAEQDEGSTDSEEGEEPVDRGTAGRPADFAQHGVAAEVEAVHESPDDERPGGAVPETDEEHCGHEVEHGALRSPTGAAQGNE